MKVPITPKAFFFGENSGFRSVLKDFIFRFGLKESVILEKKETLKDYLLQGYWPIVFIGEKDNDTFDSFYHFENIMKTPGYELFFYIIISSTEHKKYETYASSIGAQGFLKKPLQPNEVSVLLKNLLNKKNMPWIEYAANINKKTFLHGDKGINTHLEKLTKNPLFAKQAKTALIFLEQRQGLISKAESRIQAMIEEYGDKDLRSICNAADFYRDIKIFNNAIKFYKIVDGLQALPYRKWDLINIYLEMDLIDKAAQLANELLEQKLFEEQSIEVISRIMYFMGLQKHISLLLSATPTLKRNYETFLRENISEQSG